MITGIETGWGGGGVVIRRAEAAKLHYQSPMAWFIQGSLLGPILFLIFTNDHTSYLENNKIVLYADDVQFLHRGEAHQISELQSRVEHPVNVVKRWFTANSLTINPT